MRFLTRNPIPRACGASLLAAVAACALPGALSATGTAASAARDFEQPLPPVERLAARSAPAHGEGPVTFRSGTIVAPATFDAVGLAGELRPVEFRARASGGTWSRWFETAGGDPAWFGGADEVQLRTRGWRPRGRLHYVSVPAAAMRAAPAEPTVIKRGAWGANARKGGCQPRVPADYGRVKAAVVHHTVGSNKYTRAEAPGVVLAICRYHRNANGWNDIGYNALVDRFGNTYVGRAGGLDKAVIGAHAQGVNAQTTGVAVMGTHTKVAAGTETIRALVRFLAWKLVLHGHTTEGRAKMISAGGASSRYEEGTKFQMKRIVGHRRTNLTECPGDALNRQLAELRRRVQRLIDKAGGPKDDGGGVGGRL